MREILFRGKRKADNTWISGLFVNNNYGAWIVNYCDIVGRFEYQEVIPETVGQFTGLYDKNGKKVFEGDIISFKYNDKSEETGFGYCTGKVVYENSEFVVKENFDYSKAEKPETLHEWLTSEQCKIIGNIHDNQELIKQGGVK